MFTSRLALFACYVIIGALLLEPLRTYAMTGQSSTSLLERENIPVASIAVFISHSTNTCSVTMRVHANGIVTVLLCKTSLIRQIPRVLATNFFQDVANAEPLIDLPKPLGCIKSASFGTTITIVFAGETSPDVSCSHDQLGQKLYQDVLAIKVALQLPYGSYNMYEHHSMLDSEKSGKSPNSCDILND
ncbi:hypothetical protein [Dictyobacter kobayashii]|uniref:Uncharacterized protein n=1 Tax=Dictyobacter kobayashii TaxID=2014872 RepID=A0A402AJF9_9CHLR|nr:hypothetical protein [Dictyobacter kobayashii]GCE19236.1 hypothetical protein KDK_30360 [Dictyobacter kobayashii]